MTYKTRSLAVLLILPLLSMSAITGFIPSVNALTQRDLSILNDQPLTATFGNTPVCGDHICNQGESAMMKLELSQAQKGKTSTTMPEQMMSQNSSMSNEMSNSMTMQSDQGMTLKLSNANLPIVIPLVKGLFEGQDVFYITTEASDSTIASALSNFTNFPVTFAPALGKAPTTSLANIYAFKNGINGGGVLGFQPNVVDSIPGQANYSPLWKINLVQWNDPTNATVLGSESDIMNAFNAGKLTIMPTTIVVNCPIVQWGGSMDGTIPAGHMKLRDSISESGSYGSAQVLNIDIDKMQVTFVAHRGFAPDGSTIYYVATDASQEGPADALGIVFANKTQNTIATSSAADLYQFSNGIVGSGPLGFQSGVASAKEGDQYYSPMWRIQVVTWKDPTMATVLENTHDLTSKSDLTDTMAAGFVVNCPFFSVDTVYAHMK
ncbi:MAG: hypothetical protein WBV92_08235 [Nitrosotalea sp.]